MLGLDLADIIKAALVFIRLGGVLAFLPMFGDSPTPVKLRIFMALGLTVCLYPLIPQTEVFRLTQDIWSLGLLVVKELTIGIVLGYLAKLSIDAIVMAAGLVGYQMGFGMANLLVPDAQQQMNAFEALYRIFVLLIFFSLNLHHIFLRAMAESFTLIPLGQLVISPDLGSFFIQVTAGIFVTAIQLSSPILVALMFTMAALGLIARTVPQINIFTLSFPVSFFVGLLVYMASFPLFPNWMSQYFESVNYSLALALRGLAAF